MVNTIDLSAIKIILNRTQHPGNIGSCARAMKNMGLSQLVLVQPCDFSWEHGMAKAMAAGAEDVLQQAQVFQSLDEALADVILLVGTSARPRGLEWSMLTPRDASELIIKEIKNGHQPVGILFGNEAIGLNNEELQRCHYHLEIPANPNYSSLNLAQAVQVISYELYQKYLLHSTEQINLTKADEYATIEQIEGFHKHLEQVLYLIKFIDPKQPKRILQRMRRIFMKARLETLEINMLRGVLTEIQRSLGFKK